MGFEVAYSQIFLAMDRPTTAAKELSQSVGYAKLTDACMQVPECVGMSTGVSLDAASPCNSISKIALLCLSTLTRPFPLAT
jgi:hypothetical protein